MPNLHLAVPFSSFPLSLQLYLLKKLDLKSFVFVLDVVLKISWRSYRHWLTPVMIHWWGSFHPMSLFLRNQALSPTYLKLWLMLHVLFICYWIWISIITTNSLKYTIKLNKISVMCPTRYNYLNVDHVARLMSIHKGGIYIWKYLNGCLFKWIQR